MNPQYYPKTRVPLHTRIWFQRAAGCLVVLLAIIWFTFVIEKSVQRQHQPLQRTGVNYLRATGGGERSIQQVA